MTEFTNPLRGAAGWSAMRRCVFVMLLFIVPFQFAWSAASAYCSHEAGEKVSHFGHHTHSTNLKAGDKTHDQKSKPVVGDDDCIGCHFNTAQQAQDQLLPVISFDAVRPQDCPPDRYRSPTPPGLERPARLLAI